MISLEWKGIESCPRVHGKPVLLFEPGFGIQVGQWDMRRMKFVSVQSALRLSLNESDPTVDDLFRSIPIEATKWADADLGDPSLDEADRIPPMTPRSYPGPKTALRVIAGGASGA